MNAFLTKWVPIILASPAYQADGLLIINFDESNYVTTCGCGWGNDYLPGKLLLWRDARSESSTVSAEHSAGGYTLVYGNYGGDQTGAILLSPFIKAGTVSTVPYNHYSMLKTVENIFKLPLLGNAQTTGLAQLGS